MTDHEYELSDDCHHTCEDDICDRKLIIKVERSLKSGTGVVASVDDDSRAIIGLSISVRLVRKFLDVATPNVQYERAIDDSCMIIAGENVEVYQPKSSRLDDAV